MFTKLEKAMIVSFLILNVGFAEGAYGVYNGFTVGLLIAIIVAWSLGLIVFFGNLIKHSTTNRNSNERRIIVKDN